MLAIFKVVLRTWFVFICTTAVFGPFSPGAQGQSEAKIIALGASNTDGWGVDRSEAYPAQLQLLLKAKGIDVAIRNAGIPGDTTGGMLARLESWLSDGVRLVILQPGTNDERMGLASERASNIEKMKARLDARGVKLLVVENSVLDALPRSELRADGIHFTPAGYALLAERILPDVVTALGK